MKKPIAHRLHRLFTASRGNVISEYGILFALVAVAAMAGVVTLGGSVSQLLGGAGNQASSNSTVNLLAPAKGNASGTLASGGSTALSSGGGSGADVGGYMQLVVDPVTNMPTVEIMTSGSAPKNATSVDGVLYNTLGTLLLAQHLDEMAKNEEDPDLAAYYAEMAKWAYYLGAAQGEMDKIPQLDLKGYDNHLMQPMSGGDYRMGNALQDVTAYQKKLQKLMTNPPPGAKSAPSYKNAIAYATDAFNIGQSYVEPLKRFIGTDGKVSQSFGVDGDIGGAERGPGGVLADTSRLQVATDSNRAMASQSYHELVSYDNVRTQASDVLQGYNVASTRVTATFQDAYALDQLSNMVK